MKGIPRAARALLVPLVLLTLPPAASWGGGSARAAATGKILKLSVQPRQIAIGRDVALQVTVTDGHGKPVDGAQVSVIGAGRPGFGRAVHGIAMLKVHAVALSQVDVQATHKGYSPASLKLATVEGSPASVAVIKRGLSVLAPGSKPRPGHVGADLFAGYHAFTSVGQFASLALRDGTLVDLNGNSDVLISDPLHQRLTKGELFMEVVHGAASHVVQVGTTVGATKGTRFDITWNAATKTARITVVTGLLEVTNGANKVLVGADQQTTVVSARPPTPPIQVDAARIVAWIKNVPPPPSSVLPPVVNLPPPGVISVRAPHAVPRTTVSGAMVSTTWSATGSPYLVTGHLDIPAGVTLRIEPGTLIAAALGAYITVEGTLLARGTADAPIVVTSAQPQPKAGDWYYLQLAGKGASASVLDNVQLYYAGYGGGAIGALWITGGAAPTISNSTFAQSATMGLYVDDGSLPRITACTFALNAGANLSLPMDDVALFSAGSRMDGPGIQVRSTLFTRDATWPRTQIPLLFSGHLDVPISRTLTLAPGVVLEATLGAYITVEGTLLARGTADAPIVVTSAQPQPKAGDWYYLQLAGKGASASVLDNVQLYYAGYGGGAIGALWITGGAAPTISNSTFAQSATMGLYVDDSSLPRITACTFASNEGLPLSLPMDDVGLFAAGSRMDGPGIQVRSTLFTRDATWPRTQIPLLFSGHLDVPISRTLTLAPGVVLEATPGAYITVEGTLLARGTADAPIVVTSAQPQPKPGDWYYLQLAGKGASTSVLDNVQLYYAGYGGGAIGALWITGGAAPTISNSTFAQSTAAGIYADSTSLPSIVACAFQDDVSYALSVPAADTTRVHDNTYGPNQLGDQLRGS